MGIGGISIWQLLIIALIIVLLFGTKKLRSLGTDLGSALKGFKNAIKDENEEEEASSKESQQLDAEKETAAEQQESSVSARTEEDPEKK